MTRAVVAGAVGVEGGGRASQAALRTVITGGGLAAEPNAAGGY